MPFDPNYRSTDHTVAEVSLASVNQLTVTVRNVIFSNPENGYFIAEVEVEGDTQPPEGAMRSSRFGAPVITLKGESPSFTEHSSAMVGESISVAGQWTQDDRGQFFKVLFTQESIPTTREALAKYLAAGRIKHVGPVLAKKLMEHFGLDLLRILDHDPERLVIVNGITPEKARAIAQSWAAKRGQFRVVSFLGLHGIGESLAKKVAEEFGNDGLEDRIRQNPYLLTHVDGIGFTTADGVAMSVGLPVDSPLRIRAALVEVLNNQINDKGNTAVPVGEWVRSAMAFVGQSQHVVEEHCQALVKDKQVVLRQLLHRRYVHNQLVESLETCASPFRIGLKENAIARHLMGHLHSENSLDMDVIDQVTRSLKDPALGLDPSQLDASLLIAKSPVSILTGGPGTGKTTTLRSLVKAFEAAGLTVLLAAPTGKAAKRMEKAIGRPAATIHRTLEFKGSLGFTRDQSNPLMGDIFILDEVSMVDTSVMAAWLDALPKSCRIIFVGDADQLPSVGPGNILRDMISSNQVPVARLSTVHRNGGLIAHTAERVRNGKAPTLPADPWVDTFAFVPAVDDDDVIETVHGLIKGFINKGHDPRSIQVLIPQKDGAVGTRSFNDSLRPLLNVEPRTDWSKVAVGSKGYLQGDRVMQVKNDYKRNVFNGDMGHVIEVAEGGRELVVQLDDGEPVRYNKEEQRQLELGFAQTVHKSQGGEMPIVIVVCVNNHSFTLNRNLLYTGITRGKERVLVVGQAKAVALAAYKMDQSLRLTGLGLEIDRVLKQMLSAKPQPSAPPVRPPAPRP